jgi:hypothetical protein
MTRLILQRASASRSAGQWKDEDYDVLADGKVVGGVSKRLALRAAGAAMDLARSAASVGRHTDSHYRTWGCPKKWYSRCVDVRSSLGRQFLRIEKAGPL